MKFMNKNILPNKMSPKDLFRSPILPLIINSVAISLDFGYPSTWTGIVTTLMFSILVLWIADRVLNSMVRGVEVKGVWVATGVAIILMLFFAWPLSYLATLYPTYEWIFMIIWFVLSLVVLKFVFFGDEPYMTKAWLQALALVLIIGVVTVVAMWLVAWIILGLAYLGLSQYWATITTTALFTLIVLILWWLDKKKFNELAETFGEAGRDITQGKKWLGDRDGY